MTLVRKLLRKNLSVGQLLGYGASGLLGLSIVLLGLQFYFDIRPVFSSNESFFKKDFLVVSKKVSLFKTVGAATTQFKESELEDIRQQPFVSKLAHFTPSTFNVELSTDGPIDGINGFVTDIFFESIPDEFLDVSSDKWQWQEGSTFIPIILPRNYLSLYNFGFAQSQGLPQFSEKMMEKVPMKVHIYGNLTVAEYKARIVGFSNKINTILVPQTFLAWANGRYGVADAKIISRLLLEVKNPTDPAITEYISKKGYEFNDDKLDAGKASYFLRMLTTIVLAVGCVITLLAVGLLMLSMSLLIHKNRSKMENLMLIGYSQRAIAAPYQRLSILVTDLVFVLSLAIVYIARIFYVEKLMVLGISSSLSLLYFAIGLAILLVICLANYCWIRAKVNAVFKPE